MENLKTQVKSQYNETITHKGKAIGAALGIISGVTYGLAGKKGYWIVSGLAIAGVVGGVIIGGMFDKKPAVVVASTDTDDSEGRMAVTDYPSAMDTAKDIVNEEGVMNIRGRATRYSNARGIFNSGSGNCYCSNTDTNVPTDSGNACWSGSLCGGVAGTFSQGRKAARTK